MFSRRSLLWTALALMLLGVGGYAYLNPSFAAACQSSAKESAAHLQGWTDSAKASLTNTSLYASVAKELRERPGKNHIQPKLNLTDIYRSVTKKLSKSAPPSHAPPAAAPVPRKTPSAAAQSRPAVQSVGQQIASGHAFAKHGGELGFKTESQMAAHIDRVIRSASSSQVRHLARGRTAYWDSASGTVVIRDPNTRDGGTAFKPNRGRSYFENLR
jgi:hypothetical protein